ncbi:MAG: hypothetical protein ACHQQQ_06385 [Bacteroidota bacterium]
MSILFCIAICVSGPAAVAQQQNPTPKHLMREDSAAVNALVMYPDTIRLHIFEACEYPAAIVSIASLQKKSSDDFVNLISSYSKNEQEDFWSLSRYPVLISKLAQGGQKSTDEINTILIEYPADIHETALKYGTEYYDQLQKMDEMQLQTNAQFEQIITDYPPVTQEALRDIIQFPEIISLLNDHLSLAVRVGDHFRRNPQGVIHRADSLNLAETRQNAEDSEKWKQRIEQNPDEANDLQNAANDYATENGYTQADLNTSPNPDEVSNYRCNPYSYWFGYPTWYPYSYWYPYPFWFDCGFYHDRAGRIAFIGSPSSYFTNWYFYAPEHWHRYPNLANAYVNHYYGSRRSVGSNTIIVHDWVRQNRNYLPKDFINNNSKRIEVIRQVGQLNIDARKQKGDRPVSPTVRDQYFQNNVSRYPSLNNDQRTKVVGEDNRRNIPDIIQPPVKQPPVRIARLVQQPVMNPGRTPAPPAYNFNRINKAAEYHRTVWEQTQPTVRPQPQPVPRPQVRQPVSQEPIKRQSPGKRN